MRKGYMILEYMMLSLIMFMLIGSMFLVYSQGKKTTEIMKERYGMDCEWYNAKACLGMLEFEEGKNRDLSIKLEQF